MTGEIRTKINEAGVIAVIIIDDLNHAVPMAQALVEGGVEAIELTLRTPVALDAARAIKKAVPEIILGFGTVLRKEQIIQVIDAGADFAVSPGCNPKIVEEANQRHLPFSPGIMTPTDIEIAIELGCRVLKYFPAETSGGLKNLQSMAAPYLHMGLQFIPLGGVNQANAQSYLESPLIAAVGGSWIAKRALIQSEDWTTITQNAIEISKLVRSIKSAV